MNDDPPNPSSVIPGTGPPEPRTPAPSLTETLLRRDRAIIVGGLALICLLCWLYVAAGTGMSSLAMTTWEFPPPVHFQGAASDWDPAYWTFMLLMWWVMMIAMMVPAAAPVILLYARAHRHAQAKGQMADNVVPTAAFGGGYLVCWLGFSAVATLLQWGLEQSGLLHTMLMWSTSETLSAGFLIAAGLYQLSPLKNVCLEHCRSPVAFISRRWRSSRAGAFAMGLEHGAFCVGCCWFLMGLLFVGGIMNLVWIAGLAIFVLLEKVAPRGDRIARVSGWVMIGAGLYLVSRALPL